MRAANFISACSRFGTRERTQALRYFVWHRGGRPRPNDWPHAIEDAPGMAKFHAEHPELRHMIGRMGYHLVLPAWGGVQQALSLRCAGAHVLDYNDETIGIVVIGDPRVVDLTAEQIEAVRWLAPILSSRAPNALHVGHSELVLIAQSERRRASNDPGKRIGGPNECPGPHFDLDAVRSVAATVSECASLEEAGLVW